LPVHFTAQAKTGMINTTRMLLLDGRLLLPLDRTLLSQLSAIEQKVTDAGNVIFTVAPSASHHADVAWAMILACRASRETVLPAVSYQSIAPRTGRFAKPATGTWRW
jgi:phage FluMu gp28-like protein